MAVEDLRKNPMMAHLLDALAAGTDIGEYGRLVFTQVARQFLTMEETLEWLQKNPGIDENAARTLYMQIGDKEFVPPKLEQIREWQSKQDFPICPNLDDPAACDVYQNLHFPEGIYQHLKAPEARRGIGN
jgi:uncharacterized protein YneF (UPF0154 family)